MLRQGSDLFRDVAWLSRACLVWIVIALIYFKAMIV